MKSFLKGTPVSPLKLYNEQGIQKLGEVVWLNGSPPAGISQVFLNRVAGSRERQC
jgi:hypothetical protein